MTDTWKPPCCDEFRYPMHRIRRLDSKVGPDYRYAATLNRRASLYYAECMEAPLEHCQGETMTDCGDFRKAAMPEDRGQHTASRVTEGFR